jgi:hypothetical protein
MVCRDAAFVLTPKQRESVRKFVEVTGATSLPLPSALTAQRAGCEGVLGGVLVERQRRAGEVHGRPAAQGLLLQSRRALRKVQRPVAPPPVSRPDSPNEIAVDGILRLCADVGLDPSDLRMLIFAFKIAAQSCVAFSKVDFVKGLTQLRWGCPRALTTKAWTLLVLCQKKSKGLSPRSRQRPNSKSFTNSRTTPTCPSGRRSCVRQKRSRGVDPNSRRDGPRFVAADRRREVPPRRLVVPVR